MGILSINIALKQHITYSTETVATGIFKKPGLNTVQLTEYGIAGDFIADGTVHGGTDQALYLYSQEDYSWWRNELGIASAPGLFGENITTEGVDLRALRIGDHLTIGDAELEITAPRVPCFKLAAKMGDASFIKKFVSAERPGAYARVLKLGTVSVGDTINVIKTDKDYVGVVEVFTLWHAKDKSKSLLNKALNSPISRFHRIKLEAWFKESI